MTVRANQEHLSQDYHKDAVQHKIWYRLKLEINLSSLTLDEACHLFSATVSEIIFNLKQITTKRTHSACRGRGFSTVHATFNPHHEAKNKTKRKHTDIDAIQ